MYDVHTLVRDLYPLLRAAPSGNAIALRRRADLPRSEDQKKKQVCWCARALLSSLLIVPLSIFKSHHARLDDYSPLHTREQVPETP